MLSGLWVPQPIGRVIVGRVCANGVAEHWRGQIFLELGLTSGWKNYRFCIMQAGWWPRTFSSQACYKTSRKETWNPSEEPRT